jgi:hypothetical protein
MSQATAEICILLLSTDRETEHIFQPWLAAVVENLKMEKNKEKHKGCYMICRGPMCVL